MRPPACCWISAGRLHGYVELITPMTEDQAKLRRVARALRRVGVRSDGRAGRQTERPKRPRHPRPDRHPALAGQEDGRPERLPLRAHRQRRPATCRWSSARCARCCRFATSRTSARSGATTSGSTASGRSAPTRSISTCRNTSGTASSATAWCGSATCTPRSAPSTPCSASTTSCRARSTSPAT